MKKTLIYSVLLSLGALTFYSSPASALTTTNNGNHKVIVTFKQDVKGGIHALSMQNSKKQNFINENKSKIKRIESHLNSVVANLSSSDIEQLKKDPNVIVEPDIKVRINDTTINAKDFSTTNENIDWGHANIGIPTNLSTDVTGKGVKIAILDTGAEINHPDLKLAGGVDCSQNSINDTNTCSTTPGAYNDDNGHGTHVTGIINSQINGIGMVGVAPNAEIYAVKVLDSTGSGYLSDILDGLNWAIANHINVVNMSFGSSTGSYAEQQAMNTARANGIILVAAAGNEGNAYGTGTNTDYPANYSNVLSVAATDRTNNRAYFSSTGKVDLSAPGYDILSTTFDGQYDYMSGTSMATPYVTGMVALYKEMYPTYTNDQIISAIEKQVKDLGTTGKDNLYGYGLIQYPTPVTTPVPSPIPTPTPTPIVNVPTGFHTTNVGYNQVGLTWTKANNTIYTLKRNKDVIYVGTGNAFIDYHVTPNTSYQYSLTAKVETTISQPTTITVKTSIPPMKVIKVIYSISTQESILLKWNEGYGYRYELYRNSTAIYNGKASSFTDKRLKAGTSYNYQLKSYDQYGQSNVYNITLKTLAPKPTAPKNFHRNSVTKNSVTVSWNKENNATYELYKNGVLIYNGASNLFKSNSLISNKNYTYSLRLKQKGIYSDMVTLTVKTLK